MSFQTTVYGGGKQGKMNSDGWHVPNKALWGVLAFVVLGLLLCIMDMIKSKKSSKNTQPKDSEQTKESDDATSKV